MMRLAIDVERCYHELDPDTHAAFRAWFKANWPEDGDDNRYIVELTIVGEGVIEAVTERWTVESRTIEHGTATYHIPTPPPMAAFDWLGPDREAIVLERRRARARRLLHGGCCEIEQT